METTSEYWTLAKRLSTQAKSAVFGWFERRDGSCSYVPGDLHVTWIAKVDKHFKAHVELNNNTKHSGNMAWDVDLYKDGERVITAYEILGVSVYNLNETWKKPQLIGFDDSLI